MKTSRLLLFALFLFPLAGAVSFSVTTDSSLAGQLKANKTAQVTVTSFGIPPVPSDPPSLCDEALEFAISTGGVQYEELFFSADLTAAHWQSTCGFVRGHETQARIFLKNSAGAVVFSSTAPAPVLSDAPDHDYSISVADVLVARNSDKPQSVFAYAEEANRDPAWTLNLAQSGVSAKFSQRSDVSFDGNTSFESATATEHYVLFFSQAGSFYAALKPAANVWLVDAANSSVAFSYNPASGEFSAGVEAGKFYDLAFSYSAAEKAAFSAEQLPATAGRPVSWNYTARAISPLPAAECGFNDLPETISSAFVSDESGAPVSFSKSSGSVRFACGLSSHNYSLKVETPAPVFAASEWAQDSARNSYDYRQFLSSNQAVYNPSDADYSGVLVQFVCFSGWTCDAVNSTSALLPAGQWRNFTVNATGNGIAKTETRSLSEGYALFIDYENNLSIDFSEVRVEQAVPGTLEFSLYALVGAQGGQSLSFPRGYGFYQSGSTAYFSIPSLAGRSSQSVLLYAMRSAGDQFCDSDEACVSNNCNASRCVPGSEYYSSPANQSSNATQLVVVSVSNFSGAPDYNQSLYAALGNYNSGNNPNNPGATPGQECEMVGGVQVCHGQYDLSDSRWHFFQFDSGNATVTSPSNKSEQIAVERGSFAFFFDAPGNWTIDFGGANATVQVSKAGDGYEYRVFPPKQPATGLATADFSPFAIALLLLALGAAAYYYSKTFSAPAFSKSADQDAIAISFNPKNRAFHSLEITDIVPPGSKAFGFSEPPASEKETVLGTSVHWRRKELAPGQEWKISYSMRPPAEKLRHASLRAADSRGKELALSSKTAAAKQDRSPSH